MLFTKAKELLLMLLFLLLLLLIGCKCNMFFISLHFQIIAFDIHLSIAVVVVVVVVTEKCRMEKSILLQRLENAFFLLIASSSIRAYFFGKTRFFGCFLLSTIEKVIFLNLSTFSWHFSTRTLEWTMNEAIQ